MNYFVLRKDPRGPNICKLHKAALGWGNCLATLQFGNTSYLVSFRFAKIQNSYFGLLLVAFCSNTLYYSQTLDFVKTIQLTGVAISYKISPKRTTRLLVLPKRTPAQKLFSP